MRTYICAVAALLVTACAHNSQITGKPEVVTHEDDLRKQAAFELGCNEQRLDVMSMDPVSYTHLDVYKRQLLRFKD